MSGAISEIISVAFIPFYYSLHLVYHNYYKVYLSDLREFDISQQSKFRCPYNKMRLEGFAILADNPIHRIHHSNLHIILNYRIFL